MGVRSGPFTLKQSTHRSIDHSNYRGGGVHSLRPARAPGGWKRDSSALPAQSHRLRPEECLPQQALLVSLAPCRLPTLCTLQAPDSRQNIAEGTKCTVYSIESIVCWNRHSTRYRYLPRTHGYLTTTWWVRSISASVKTTDRSTTALQTQPLHVFFTAVRPFSILRVPLPPPPSPPHVTRR